MDLFNSSDEAKMARNLGLSVDDLQEIFDMFDTDGSGGIDSQEFGTLMATLDIVMDDSQIQETVKKIDQDENGLIDFKEFISWFLESQEDPWGCKVAEEPMYYKDDYDSPRYEWDYDLTDQENWEAEDKFNDERAQACEAQYAKEEQERQDRWAKEEQEYEAKRRKKALKMKLLLPLYIKKLTKLIEGMTDKPMDACTNSVTVQVGQPVERGSFRVYTNQTENWAALNPPANTASAVCVDFNLRDGYCHDSLARMQQIVAEQYEKMVVPMLNQVNHLPRELRKSGIIAGKPFDSYRLEVETVDGKEVLRFVVFSGVDALGGLGKLASVDAGKLLPSFSAKFTSGFGLGDLLAPGATLKEMLTFKAEVSMSYVKELIRLVHEVICMIRKASGDAEYSYEFRDMKRQSMAVAGFCKFFVAQRSLFYFQFETPFEWARQMVHEFVVPMLLEQAEKSGAPIVKAPPSPEVIDGILDAIGNISGSTIANIKSRLESDAMVPNPMNGRMMPPLAILKENMRLDAAKEEAAKEDGDQMAKMVVLGWEAFCCFYKVVSGVAAVRGLDQIAEAGVEVKGWNFMDLIPSPEAVEAAGGQAAGMPWYMSMPEQYARKMQGDPEAQVDEDLIKALTQEFSELVAVAAAALPLIECVNMDFVNEQSNGMGSKAEEEARKLFGSV
jgi:hypothetical protein